MSDAEPIASAGLALAQVPTHQPSESSTTTAHSPSNLNLPHTSYKDTGSPPPTLSRPLRLVAHMPPSLFTLTMSTGILSVLLRTLPYDSRWSHILATCLFLFNLVLFLFLVLGSLLRYTLLRGTWSAVWHHQNSFLFWGCAAMGGSTLLVMLTYVTAEWGAGWRWFSYGLWWVDVVASIGISICTYFWIFSSHNLAAIAPPILLPSVTPVVLASATTTLASLFLAHTPQLSRSLLIIALFTWGIGVPLAFLLIALFLNALLTHGLPRPAANLPGLFLPLGPMGQGAFGIISMGTLARRLHDEQGISLIAGLDAEAGRIVGAAAEVTGMCVGMVMWGMGFCWYAWAHIALVSHARRNPSYLHSKNFGIGFVATVFPIGVFTTATTSLAALLDSPALRVIGVFLTIQVAIYWAWCIFNVSYAFFEGRLCAPDLTGFPGGFPERRYGAAAQSRNDTEAAEAKVEAGQSAVDMGAYAAR